MARPVQKILKAYKDAKSDRANWEGHWQEIADRVLPNYSEHFNGNTPTPGNKRNAKMIDATAPLGMERFGAAMESMLTPRNGKWHFLRPSDPELLKDKETAVWFENKTNLLFQLRYGARANYASQQHESYMQMGAFGTGVLYTDPSLDRSGFRYKSVSISHIYFVENFQGIIDKAYRRFDYTAEQAIEHFGRDAVSQEISNAVEKEPNRKFEFVHATEPNFDLDPDKIDFRGMAFNSCYIEVDQEHKVHEEGHATFPYAVNRYVTTPGEIYGRSPAMLALPAIKTLNMQKEHVLMQGEYAVRPVTLTHDDGIMSMDMQPGAEVIGGISANGHKLIQPYDHNSNLAVGFEMMEQERQVINDAFLVSLFQILVDTPTMTATEVLERAREKGALLSPTMGRQQSEALAPLIEREVSIMEDQGFLADMPDALIEAEGEFEIVYDSPLTRSMKAEEASGLVRYMEVAGNHAAMTGDPSMMDLIDPDSSGRNLIDIFAVPASNTRSPEQVAEVREARSQQQQMEQAVNAAPAVAGLMKGAQ